MILIFGSVLKESIDESHCAQLPLINLLALFDVQEIEQSSIERIYRSPP